MANASERQCRAFFQQLYDSSGVNLLENGRLQLWHQLTPQYALAVVFEKGTLTGYWVGKNGIGIGAFDLRQLTDKTPLSDFVHITTAGDIIYTNNQNGLLSVNRLSSDGNITSAILNGSHGPFRAVAWRGRIIWLNDKFVTQVQIDSRERRIMVISLDGKIIDERSIGNPDHADLKLVKRDSDHLVVLARKSFFQSDPRWGGALGAILTDGSVLGIIGGMIATPEFHEHVESVTLFSLSSEGYLTNEREK